MAETNLVKIAQAVGQATTGLNKAMAELRKRVDAAEAAGLEIEFEGVSPDWDPVYLSVRLPPVVSVGPQGLADGSEAVAASLA